MASGLRWRKRLQLREKKKPKSIEAEFPHAVYSNGFHCAWEPRKSEVPFSKFSVWDGNKERLEKESTGSFQSRDPDGKSAWIQKHPDKSRQSWLLFEAASPLVLHSRDFWGQAKRPIPAPQLRHPAGLGVGIPGPEPKFPGCPSYPPSFPPRRMQVA